MSEVIATVRISVDFPGAEGIWVTCRPIHRYEPLRENMHEAVDQCLDGMAFDAGSLVAEIKPYREAKKLLSPE